MKSCETTYDIHSILKNLIEQKSARDHSNFSLCQLAKAIGMPHSILSKLTHDDPTRRVHNPRIDTLSKIVSFFRQDGFDVSMDHFLGFKPYIRSHQSIPLYFFDSDLRSKIGTVEVELFSDAKNLIAFVSDAYIEPMFKKGSVFIVDTQKKPENNHLIAVKFPQHDNILIKKYVVEGHQIFLKSHDQDPSPLILFPTVSHQIIGVVVQANAKT